jgi:hypothetical protein
LSQFNGNLADEPIIKYLRETCLSQPPKNITLNVSSRATISSISWLGIYPEKKEVETMPCPASVGLLSLL